MSGQSAISLRATGRIRDFASALEYYKKVEAIQPESHNVLFYAGSCLAELERYEEALQYFFKLDFIESNCIKHGVL